MNGILSYHIRVEKSKKIPKTDLFLTLTRCNNYLVPKVDKMTSLLQNKPKMQIMQAPFFLKKKTTSTIDTLVMMNDHDAINLW